MSRDEEIVSLIERGYLASRVGRKFGITSERVRQIIKERTGKSLKDAWRSKYSRVETTFCNACGKKLPKDKRILCSGCFSIVVVGRDPRSIATCEVCGKEFRPLVRGTPSRYTQRSCSRKCGSIRSERHS